MEAADEYPDGPTPDSATKNPADQFMDVVDRAAATMGPEKYARRAFICLNRDAFPRKQCIQIVDWPWFDRIVLTLIILNCFTMLLFSDPVLAKMYSTEPDKAIAISDYAAGRGAFGWNSFLKSINAPPNAGTAQGADCELGSFPPCSAGEVIDLIFLVAFTFEMLFKLLAFGLVLHPGAYFRVGWNWLDAVVVVTGWMTLAADSPGTRPLRLFKALRPLRSMQRIRGMRVIVSCILAALPQLGTVVVFLVFVLSIFGIVGVQLFKGSLRHQCFIVDADHPTDRSLMEETGQVCAAYCERDDYTGSSTGFCESLGNTTTQVEGSSGISKHRPGQWIWTCNPGEHCLCGNSRLADPDCSLVDNPNYGINHFDNVVWAMVSLFQAISLEGWVDIMYTVMDGSGFFSFIYFIIVIVLGALIVINLFLAVLCDNFNMADSNAENGEPEGVDGEKETAKELLTLTQSNPIRAACLWVCKQAWFNHVIFVCICLNTILMMGVVRPQPGYGQTVDSNLRAYDYMWMELYWTLFALNAALTFIFVCESTIKLLGLGPRLFVKDLYNVFDVVVVFVSVLELIFEILKHTSSDLGSAVPGLSVLRSFRILRLLKLVRSVPSLRRILSTLLNSIKSVSYLFLLLVLVMVIFALLGMELFGGFYPRPEYNYTRLQMPFVWKEWPYNYSDYDKGFTMNWDLHPWDADKDITRYNFDSFGDAFISIFVVLSGENWNEIYQDQHRATWDEPTRGPMATIYFLILFVVGNLLLFNLFIAILLSNFDDDDAEEEEEDDDLLDEPEPLADADENDGGIGLPPSARTAAAVGGGESEKLTFQFGKYRPEKEKAARDKSPNPKPSFEAKSEASSPNGTSATEGPRHSSRDGDANLSMPPPDEPSGDKSLMLFSWSNPFRRRCAEIISHPQFDPIVVCLIICSSITLALGWPGYNKDQAISRVLQGLDYTFTTLFTLECVLKVVAMGLIYSKDKRYPAYLRSGWNVLDFIVVLISLITLSPVDIAVFKTLRALRALRPLRLISRREDLKQCVDTLLQSIPAMSVLMTVAGLFFLIFAILGVELFGGKFGYCLDPEADCDANCWNTAVVPGINKSITGGDDFQDDYQECMARPKYNLSRHTTSGVDLKDMADQDPETYMKFVEFPQWVNPHFGHFDDVFWAWLLLFEVAALEGWPSVMFLAMDSDMNNMYVEPWRFDTQVDQHKLEDRDGIQHEHTANRYLAAMYFFLWIVIGCFVVMNMAIGVVVDTFSRIRDVSDGCALMTDEQQDWVRAQKQVFALRPLRQAVAPKEPWRAPFFDLVSSNKFDVFIMAAIFINMMCMGLDMHDPGSVSGINDFIFGANMVFTAIYIIEMVFKLIAYGPMQYFQDGWNAFDFVLVMLSILDLSLGLVAFAEEGQPSASDLPVPAPLIRVLRLFRVVRILRIIKTAKKLRAIIMTVVISIPALFNIGSLVLLLLFIYSVLCVELFAKVNYTPGNWGEAGGGGTQAPPNSGILQYINGSGVNNLTLTGSSSPDDGIKFDGTYDTVRDYFYSGTTNYGEFVNRHANFENFGMALLTLARCVTGESFNGIMHDVMSDRWADNRLRCCPNCGPIIDGEETSSCGDSFMAIIVYLSFQLIMAYIVMSLAIGVILENFANVGSETRKITMEQLEEFREVWLKYDPKGTFTVPSHNLLAILQQLHRPLGIVGSEPAMTRSDMLKHLGDLDIPDHGGYIHFIETLTAVADAHAGVAVPLCDTTRKMQKQMLKMPMVSKLEEPAHNALTNYLVSLLQSRWRGYAMRKKYSGEPGFDENMPELAADVPQPMPTGEAGNKVKGNQVAPQP